MNKSKAVLVMDMPNFCDQCPIVALDEEIGFYCPKMMNTLPEMIAYKAKVGDYFYKGKPDWCPLIPEPKWQLNSAQHVIGESQKTGQDLKLITGYHLGWNACIDYLEGKENE